MDVSPLQTTKLDGLNFYVKGEKLIFIDQCGPKVKRAE